MIVDDMIYYKGMIYLVPKSELKKNIMKASHDSHLASHHGF
jgi:hypothetical protein